MKIKIRGKLWDYQEVPYLGDKDGDCDDPSTPNKKIRIVKSLKGQDKLVTRLHELWHAAQWDLKEETIEQVSEDVGRIFYKRFGYREIRPILQKIAKEYDLDEKELIKNYE